MALSNIKVPLYDSSGENRGHELTVDEFAGRIRLTLTKCDVTVQIECYFNDLERAWNAVKNY